VEQESDEALMLQVAQGDTRAFAVLFDRHAASVVRFAHRFVGDRGRAEELAQDVFVKLYRSARGYRPSARFRTYLFRVAANHCLNEVRRGEYRMSKSRQSDRSGEAPPIEPAAPDAESPDQTLWGKQLERAVGEALSRMTERERAAFCMCRFEGLAYRDIAEALSASEAAVKSLIHRATLAVARRIEELKSGAIPQRSRA
jgi:RNA polymerase sigma-70 factor (ECF subfamily)